MSTCMITSHFKPFLVSLAPLIAVIRPAHNTGMKLSLIMNRHTTGMTYGDLVNLYLQDLVDTQQLIMAAKRKTMDKINCAKRLRKVMSWVGKR